MPVLENPSHEIFAREIAKGKLQREAYRLAGYESENDRATDANACRLLSTVNVAARVKEIQERAAKRAEGKQTIECIGLKLILARPGRSIVQGGHSG